MLVAYCVICSDNFDLSNNASATKCGHTFHDECLARWLSQSKSCPTCRLPATSKNVIKKLYFEVSADSSINVSEDPSLLKNEIINLNFILNNLRSEIDDHVQAKLSLTSNLNSANEANANFMCRSESLEVEIVQLKSKIRIMKNEAKDYISVRRECQKLKEHLELFQNVQSIVDGLSDNIDMMMHSYSNRGDIKSLVTMISVLRNELQATHDKSRKFKNELDRVNNVQKNVNSDLLCLKEKYSSLAENLDYSERERKSLEEKLQELKASLNSCQSSNSTPNVTSSAKSIKLAQSHPNLDLNTAATPSPIYKPKKRLVTVGPSRPDHWSGINAENLPSNIGNYRLFKKKRTNFGMTKNFMSELKVKNSQESPPSLGISKIHDGLGGRKRFLHTNPDSLLSSKLDKSKNIKRPKIDKSKQNKSFNQLNITDQLIMLD